MRDDATHNRNRGAFYSNFESKDELFLILITAHLDVEITTLAQSLSRIERAEDPAPAIERRYRVLGDNSSWCLLTTEFQLYAMRGGKKAAEFDEIYESYRERLGTLLEEHIERLGLRSTLTPYEFGVSLVALSHGLFADSDGAFGTCEWKSIACYGFSLTCAEGAC